jgi:ABC-type phosphate transport system substrate-binding protein
VAVIVNPANNVSKLTREQLEKSLLEEIKTGRSWWADEKS